VSELPAYEPCGAGEHLYVDVEKQDLTTDAAAAALARACGQPLRAVGYAGRKDRHARARQRFSVQGGDERDLAKLAVPPGARLEVLRVSRHRNKLRLGHLRGNRFELDLDAPGNPTARARLTAALAELARRGAANRFGPQRFGVRGSTLEIARAWAAGDWGAALGWLFDPAGAWRPGQELPRRAAAGPALRALRALREDPADAQRALRAAGRAFRDLVASAAQSAIFNAVLDARAAAGLLHRLRAGDIALGPRGGPFVCQASDLPELERRAAPGVLEVRASGPLPGWRAPSPSAEVLAEERSWSAHTGIDWSWFERAGPLQSVGERRALIAPFVEPPQLEERDGGVQLRFALPPGSYATSVLEELGVALPAARGGGEAAADPRG
jgi:tRNA pseudouridine13 synthase